MKRLTNAFTHEARSDVTIREMLSRLAAYEDTGMSPDELNDLRRDLRDCRNELCLKCGDYKMAHKGACDDCRWKDMGD